MSVNRKIVNLGSLGGEDIEADTSSNTTSITTTAFASYDTQAVTEITGTGFVQYDSGLEIFEITGGVGKVEYTYPVDVEGSLDLAIGNASSNSLDITYSAIVANYLDVKYSFSMQNSLNLDASLMAKLENELTVNFDLDLYNKVENSLNLSARLPVITSLDISATLQSTVNNSLDAVFDLELYNSVENNLSVAVPIQVSNAIDFNYEINGLVQNSIDLSTELTVAVENSLTVNTDILNYNIVQNSKKISTSIGTTNLVNISSQPKLLVNGKALPLLSASVAIDEGSPFWTCDVALGDLAAYDNLTVDTAFSLDLYGEIYEFIVESRTLGEPNESSVGFRITGLSPSAVLDDPRVDLYSKTWDTAVNASEAATYNTTGVTVNWNVIDWVLPAYRFSVENTTPLDTLLRISEAVGGIVVADINGDLNVQYQYPVQVPNYDTVVPDHIITDVDDVFTRSETENPRRTYNSIRIVDIEPNISDNLSVEDDENLEGVKKLKATIVPWRDLTNIAVRSTGGYNPYNRTLEEETIVEELVVVTDGKGSTQMPIHSIVNFTYSTDNLGGLTFDFGTRDVFTSSTENRYGLIKLTYTTKYIQYNISGSTDDSVLYVLEDGDL